MIQFQLCEERLLLFILNEFEGLVIEVLFFHIGSTLIFLVVKDFFFFHIINQKGTHETY